MRRSLVLLSVLLLPLTASAGLFGGGAKAPWSEVDGTGAPADAVAVTVLAVDKKPLSMPKAKLTLAPGAHGLTVASTKSSANGTVAVPYVLEAAACTRYRIAGRRIEGDDTRMEIVVAQEPIAGCVDPLAAQPAAGGNLATRSQ